MMSAISISLSDDEHAKLNNMAKRYGVEPEDLVRIGIEELLSRPEEEFQEIVNYVLEKNADLYRRLA